MSGLRKIWLWFWMIAVATYGGWAQDISSTYAQYCAHCHGADGRGDTVLGRALKLRDLRSPDVHKLSDDQLVAILGKGTDGGKMPGFQKKLGASTVRELAGYVRAIETEPLPVVRQRTTHPQASFDPGNVRSAYAVKCSHCHGLGGSGDTALGRILKIRDLGSAESQNLSDKQMREIIARGTNGGRMPGFRKKLGDDMVQRLVPYIRGLAGREAAVEIAKLPAVSPTTREPAASGARERQVHCEMQPREDMQAHEPHSSSPSTKPSLPSVPHHKSNEPVDLNSASKATLLMVPGITDADADRIIAGRPYKSTLQFKTRGVVSRETYARIAGRVVARKPVRSAQITTFHDETH